jgi:hypothetical protein
MSYKFKNNFPKTRKARKPVKNPTTGQRLIGGKTYDVGTAAEKLASLGVSNKPSPNTGPIENSLSVLDAFGFSVVNTELDFSLIDGDGLDSKKLENFKKTEDENPNRLQEDKFKKLKNKKVPADKIFDQTTTNPINEIDPEKSQEMISMVKKPTNTIQLTDDFLNFSNEPLAKRIDK